MPEMQFIELVQDAQRDDGYVNATKWAKAFNYRLDNWKELPETKARLKQLETTESLKTREFNDTKDTESLIISDSVSKKIIYTTGRGYGAVTWVHPIMAIHLASYLDPAFANYVAEIFVRYVTADPHLAADIAARQETIEGLDIIYDAVQQRYEHLKSKINRQLHISRDAWGDKLRYNTLTQDIEFNGQVLDIGYAKSVLANRGGISKSDASSIIGYLSKENSYSPVVEYLHEVAAKFPSIDTNFLNELAKLFFGTDDPLHANYFKDFLVASVNRACNPGCQINSALLLFVPKERETSTFWRTLYGNDFFSDDLLDGRGKNQKKIMRRFWCLKWKEFETAYKQQGFDHIEYFINRTYDTERIPPDKWLKDYKRTCLFVGTITEKTTVNELAGDSTFCIIPVTQNIPVEEVQKLRDKIWAAAVSISL